NVLDTAEPAVECQASAGSAQAIRPPDWQLPRRGKTAKEKRQIRFGRFQEMDQITSTTPRRSSDGIEDPLREPVFRRIWLASLLSNFGMLVQGVGAAWAMTLMTSSADKVALVQTAAMLPTMLISIAAGAIADMYDRRVVALVGLSIALVAAVALSALTFLNAITPNILLLFCFIVGTGMALFGPSWQASVSEQVSPEPLPSAVAL